VSTVVQFCVHLDTQRHAAAAAAAADAAAAGDSGNDYNDDVFLLTTLCQLYLDIGDGECYIYTMFTYLYIFVYSVYFIMMNV